MKQSGAPQSPEWTVAGWPPKGERQSRGPHEGARQHRRRGSGASEDVCGDSEACRELPGGCGSHRGPAGTAAGKPEPDQGGLCSVRTQGRVCTCALDARAASRPPGTRAVTGPRRIHGRRFGPQHPKTMSFKTQKTILDSNSQISANAPAVDGTRAFSAPQMPPPRPHPAPRSHPPPLALCAWPLKTTTFANPALGPVTQPDTALR